jgi:hypothetical protein
MTTYTKRAELEYKLRIYAKELNLSDYFFPFIKKCSYSLKDNDDTKLNALYALSTISKSEHVWKKKYKNFLKKSISRCLTYQRDKQQILKPYMHS